MMRLNSLKPKAGSQPTPKRLGRGPGSGLGKTSGRGHKGQHARAGGFHKVGFEGGQMPLQRRLPKRGFHSLSSSLTAEVRLGDLSKIKDAVIDLSALKKADLVSAQALSAKVYLAGSISKAVTLKGVRASKGARAAIEQAGGKFED